MKNIIYFLEEAGTFIPKSETHTGYIQTKKLIENNVSPIYTTQMCLMNFDLIDKGYSIILVKSNSEFPYTHILPSTILHSGKILRRSHNLLKLFMGSSFDGKTSTSYSSLKDLMKYMEHNEKQLQLPWNIASPDTVFTQAVRLYQPDQIPEEKSRKCYIRDQLKISAKYKLNVGIFPYTSMTDNSTKELINWYNGKELFDSYVMKVYGEYDIPDFIQFYLVFSDYKLRNEMFIDLLFSTLIYNAINQEELNKQNISKYEKVL